MRAHRRKLAIVEGFGVGENAASVVRDVGQALAAQQVAQPNSAGFQGHPGAAMQPAFVDRQISVGKILNLARGVEALPDDDPRREQVNNILCVVYGSLAYQHDITLVATVAPNPSRIYHIIAQRRR